MKLHLNVLLNEHRPWAEYDALRNKQKAKVAT